MYRPNFSGFLWTTILCLDNRNPSIEREYHPQACSIIPGVFVPIEPDKSRRGVIVDYVPEFDERDLQVRIIDRKIVKSAVDFDSHKAVVSFGKGVKDSPEPNISWWPSLQKRLKLKLAFRFQYLKSPFL